MEISFKNISINLPDSLDKMSSYIDKPFIIFEKNNFLDQETYQNLVNEVHSINDFEFKFNDRGDKLRTSIGGHNVDKINKKTLKNFCQVLLQKDFFNWFKKTHLSFFRSKPIKIYLTNANLLIIKIIGKINKKLNLPFSFYYTEIEYSLILKDGYIPPHTDAPNKRLSFVYYIPSNEIALTNQMKENLGTVFWEPKDQKSEKFKLFHSKLLTGENKESFYENHKINFIAKYEANKIAGFIKSDISWHTVEKNEFDYPRRAIVINIYEL